MLHRTVLCAAVLVLLWPQGASAAGRTVAIRAADGRIISGLLFESAQRPSPAVVLVPMLGRTRDDWQSVAQRLAEGRISALAIDLPSAVLPGDTASLLAWHLDVRAALDYLSARAEVNAAALGVAGASVGANLAAAAASADLRVRSLALISPSLDYRGLRIEGPLRQYGARPALLIASVRDPLASRTVRELTKEAPGPRETRWAETAAHGMTLLAHEPDLVRALVAWFQRTLVVN